MQTRQGQAMHPFPPSPSLTKYLFEVISALAGFIAVPGSRRAGESVWVDWVQTSANPAFVLLITSFMQHTYMERGVEHAFSIHASDFL